VRLSDDLSDRIERAHGRRVVGVDALSGGCVADVRAVRFADGSRCVAKIARAGGLAIEGWMLGYLTEHSRLPLPTVLHCEDTLLLLEHVANDGGRADAAGERGAADDLAELHSVTRRGFGLERDTVIGGLPQPNQMAPTWVEFFRDRRLLFMGNRALAAGALSSAAFGRLEHLCARLDAFVDEPCAPALVHGDVWSGNVLVRAGSVVAFVDPAIYYADAEIELAFITLFSSFGDAFFDRYRERHPLRPGFFEVRRDLYNLYPLLVHATLFGGGYGAAVARTLERFVG